MARFKLFLLFIMLLIPFATAQDYYADVDINVEDNGLVSIEGNTNNPKLKVENTHNFTSKEGRYWVVNITIDDKFSDYIYHLNLPENSNVNYLKTPGFSRIEHSSSGLSVIGTGENQSFYVVAQYSLNYSNDNTNYLYLFGILFLAAVVFVFAYYRKPKAALPPLTDRQKIIYNTVNKYKKPITQKEIEKKTALPKASVSRNIETLVQKGVLKKEVKGMSNVISVPERSADFRKN